MKRKNRKDEEERIIAEMYADSGSNKDDSAPSDTAATDSKIKNGTQKPGDIIRCPKCGYVLDTRSVCPRCGYNGYIPMTQSETRKIKLILYPILLIIVILYILWQRGVFG